MKFFRKHKKRKIAGIIILLIVLLIGVMAIVFLALAFKEKAFIEGGIMFALIGINLPSLLKYAFFLYLEATDEGEYFE